MSFHVYIPCISMYTLQSLHIKYGPTKFFFSIKYGGRPRCPRVHDPKDSSRTSTWAISPVSKTPAPMDHDGPMDFTNDGFCKKDRFSSFFPNKNRAKISGLSWSFMPHMTSLMIPVDKYFSVFSHWQPGSSGTCWSDIHWFHWLPPVARTCCTAGWWKMQCCTHAVTLYNGYNMDTHVES